MIKDAGVYLICSIQTNKRYVGSSTNLHNRKEDHLRLLRKNKHHSLILQNHCNKYGIADLFFIELEICVENIQDKEQVKKDLLQREQYWIDTIHPEFNICRVAGSRFGTILSEKAVQNRINFFNSDDGKQIMREFGKAKKLYYQTEKGKITIQKISSKKKEYYQTEKGKLYLQQHMMGENNPSKNLETIQKIKEKNTGQKLSEQARKNQSIGQLKFFQTEKGKQLQEIKKTKRGKDHHFFGKHHTEKTKQLIKTARQNDPIQTCIYCDFQSKSKGNIERWHNENCKQNPNYIPKLKKEDTRIIMICSYCGIQNKNPGTMLQYHFDNCKKKPGNENLKKERTKDTVNKWKETYQKRPLQICPHCGFQGRNGGMKHYHFDNCKINPNKTNKS
jgi:group I intron endonuclease